MATGAKTSATYRASTVGERNKLGAVHHHVQVVHVQLELRTLDHRNLSKWTQDRTVKYSQERLVQNFACPTRRGRHLERAWSQKQHGQAKGVKRLVLSFRALVFAKYILSRAIHDTVRQSFRSRSIFPSECSTSVILTQRRRYRRCLDEDSQILCQVGISCITCPLAPCPRHA